MKRKLVSRALPSVLVAGGLLVTGTISATAADGATSSVEQQSGGLGDLLSGTVDAVVGTGGAVDSTLTQVTDTVEQVTKKDGAVDDTVTGVTGAVDAVAGKDGAVDDVLKGVTSGGTEAPAAGSGPVEDVVRGVSGAVTSVAGEEGAVDDVLGADAPRRGVTDDLPAEIIGDVGSVGENLGRGDVPGTIGAITGEDGVVDDLLESPERGGPGGGDPGDGGDGDGGGSGDGSDDGGTIPVANTPGLGTGVDIGLPIQAIGEAQAPGALAQTGVQVAGVAAVALGLTAAGAALVRARRRMLAPQD